MSRHRQDYPLDESPSPSPPPNSPTRGPPPADRVAPNVLTRAIQATGMTSAISSTSNGLMRALEVATRARAARNSSSDKLPHANQARSSETSSSSYSLGQDGGFGPGLHASYQIGFGQDASVGYQSDFVTQDRHSQQTGSHHRQVGHNGNGPEPNVRNNLGEHVDSSQRHDYHQKHVDAQKGPGYRSLPGQQNKSARQTPSRLERLVHETDRHLYQRLLTISQNLGKLPGMPPDVATVLSTELYHIYEDYAAQSKKVNSEYNDTEAQRDNLVREIAKSQGVAAKYQRDSVEYRRLFHDAAANRDRASAEKDQFKKRLNELSGKQLQLEQQLLEMEEKHAVSLKSLHSELRFKEEQIMAKRTLWMTARQDSFGKSAGPAYDSSVTPSRVSRMSTYLPSGPAASSQGHWGPLAMSGSAPGSRAHYRSGSEQDGSPQMALIPFRNDVEIAEEFGAGFEKIYDLALKWTQKYTHELKKVEVDQATSRSAELWTFMKSCTYEDDRDAHIHVIHLLRDSKARPFLLMRMIVQILCNDIWTPSNFEDFDQTTKPKFEYFRERLQTRGLSPEGRAKVIGQQTDLIESMIEQNIPYLIYRNTQVSRHAKTLRARTGPLLDTGVRRSDAGDGLIEIAHQAFDLSAKMFTSNRTFVIKFPECGGKFLPTSMVSRNPYDAEAPLDNQLRQARVKLAITPVITMRDDRFMTIQVKDIQHSHVLIMI